MILKVLGRASVFLFFTMLSVSAYAQTYGLQGVTPITRTYGFIGTLFDITSYYSETESVGVPATNNTWDNHTSVFDIKLGYINSEHYYFGALYTTGRDNHVSADASERRALGLGGGYFSYNGFNFRGYYLLDAAYGDYSDGKGWQAELGYAINPTSRFYIGFALSHRQVTYDSNSQIVGFTSWTRIETYPSVMLGVLFF